MRIMAGLVGMLLFVAPASAHEFAAKGVTVAHPWVRATPPGATVTAAYLEIKGAKGVSDRLKTASAPGIGRVELHATTFRQGIASMSAVDSIAVPAGQAVVLGPTGLHLMLLDVAQPLKEGEALKMTLDFEKAGPIEIEASIEPPGAKGPHGFDHQPGHEPSGGKTSRGPSGHGAHKH